MKDADRVKFMRELFYLIIQKAVLNLRSEAQRSYLSYAWWVLEPALHMSVFYFVFGKLLQRGTGDYVPFLLTGLIPWLWFAKTIPNASGSIVNAKNLILQVYLPKIFFPMVIVMQDLFKQAVVFLVLFCFLVIYGYELSLSWLGVLPVIAVQLIFTIACAVLVSVVTPFLPDIRFIIGSGIQLLMFASGIFYSYEILLPEHQFYFLMNPVASLLVNYRQILIDGGSPDWLMLGWISTGSLLVLIFLLWIAARFDSQFSRLVME